MSETEGRKGHVTVTAFGLTDPGRVRKVSTATYQLVEPRDGSRT